MAYNLKPFFNAKQTFFADMPAVMAGRRFSPHHRAVYWFKRKKKLFFGKQHLESCGFD
jgi:hypothetical protein